MPEVIEITIYSIEELEGKAKEKACEKMVDFLAEICNHVDLKEFFSQELAELGYPVDDINWSLGYCQGDGMSFYGKIENVKKVALAIGLSQSEAEYLKDYSITIIKNGWGSRYCHWNTMGINEESIEDSQFYELNENGKKIKSEDPNVDYIVNKIYDKFRAALLPHIQQTSKRLETKGYEIIEGNRSKEACIDFANANEYRFTKDGKLWDY